MGSSSTQSSAGDVDSMVNDYNSGDIAWMLASSAFALMMVPGASLFYAGLTRRKSALSLLTLPILATCIVSLQWLVIGFSLTCYPSKNPFIGNLNHAFFLKVLEDTDDPMTPKKIPMLLFGIYGAMYACVTIALAVGAVAERGRLAPCLLFAFVWTTLVYDPIAYSTFVPTGWSKKIGGLDFAGGTPVHITSGSAALVYSYMLGKRRGHGTFELNFRPHNTTMVVLGTMMLWIGWFGFNGGSALAANVRTVIAAINSNLAASAGGLAWCAVDYRIEKKFSAVGLCSGIVAGLVCITPGCGYVPPWAAVVYGVLAGTICNLGTKMKVLLRVDDALDIFAIHGIGGLLGDVLTGLFANRWVAGLDGTEIRGGWLDGNWTQLPIQLGDGLAGMIHSAVFTFIILFVISYIPGMHLRTTEHEEIGGMDDSELGEFAYDYVEITRDVATSVEGTGIIQSRSDSQLRLRASADEISLQTYAMQAAGKP